jgi:hypothetical protein
MADIPGLEFSIRQSLDRLEWQYSVYNEEFIQRLLLVMGHPLYFTSTAYGVVAEVDPTSNLAGGSQPLVVSANASPNPTSVDINPGMAVTRSGMWIYIPDFIRNIELADSTEGVANVVYVQYSLQSSDLQENDFKEWVSPLNTRIGDSPNLEGITGLTTDQDLKIRIDTLDTYNGYPESETDDFVPLAVVSTQTVVDPDTSVITTSLSIDMTRDNYDFNRPWFSPVDIEHRNKLGNGVQTNANTHALGQSDISDGDFSPYQIALNHGVVLAKDQSIAKIPGYRCESAFQVDQLQTDDANGTETGFALKKYAELPYFPLRLGRCWVDSTDDDMAALIVPETNRVVFAADDPPAGETVNMYYTRAEACEPPVGKNEVSFSTNNPRDGEIVIAGGVGHKMLASTQEGFSNEQKFPMRYQLFVDAEGAIRKTPQVIYCYKKLDVLGTQDDITLTQYGPGHVMMGLADASGAATMSVKIRVYGTDTSGADVNYLFEFDSSYTPFTLPNTNIPTSALKINDSLFASVTSVVVEERIDDGPNSAIMLWVINTPYDTYDLMKDACHICDTMWDGLRMTNIHDKRIVETTDRDFLVNRAGQDTFEYMVSTFAGGRESIYVEDFRRPVYHVLQQSKDYYDFGSGSDILKYLPHYNFNKLQVGLEGVYRTRALPVMPGSGTVWRLIALPMRKESGTNVFVPGLPRIRFKVPAGWSSWAYLNPVPGVPNTWERDLGGVVDEVQFEIDPYPHVGIIIFG